MFPILFRVGSIAVRSYTVLLDAGLLAGLALTYGLWRRRGLAPQAYLDVVTWALLGGVVGGRVVYVAVNWAYFSEHLAEALAIWTGGVSFHGAFMGGWLAVMLYSLLARRSFWVTGDTLSAGLALGSILGWLACFASGCAYGVIGKGPFFFVSPDIYGVEASRFASQPMGAAQSAVLLVVVLVLLCLKARPGIAFSMYLILYFGGQFALEFLRGDETVSFGIWRLAQIADAVFALAGAVLLIVACSRRSLRESLTGKRTYAIQQRSLKH